MRLHCALSCLVRFYILWTYFNDGFANYVHKDRHCRRFSGQLISILIGNMIYKICLQNKFYKTGYFVVSLFIKTNLRHHDWYDCTTTMGFALDIGNKISKVFGKLKKKPVYIFFSLVHLKIVLFKIDSYHAGWNNPINLGTIPNSYRVLWWYGTPQVVMYYLSK